MRLFQKKARLLSYGLPVVMLCLIACAGCGQNAGPTVAGTGTQPCFTGKGPVPGPVMFHAMPGQAGLYAEGKEGIYRFSTAGGHLTSVWLYRMHDCVTLTPTIVPGLAGPSYPLPYITDGLTVADNMVFFGAYEKTNSSWVDLYALHAGDGSLAWKLRVTDASQISGLLVSGGLLYIEFAASTDGSQVDIIRALDVRTGSLRWSYRFQTVLTAGAQGINDIGDGALYITASHSLYALNAATGRQMWSANISGDQQFIGALHFDRVVYVTASSGCFNCEVQPNSSSVYAFDEATGALLWQSQRVAGFLTVPEEAHGLVYVGSQDGHLYALNATDGTVRWRSSVGGELHVQPQLVNGIVCVGTALFLGTDNPNTTATHLFGYDAATGRRNWSYTFPLQYYFGYAPLIAGNGLLYTNPANNLIDIFQASTGKLVQEYSVTLTSNFLTLAYAR